ncbi:Leucyl aminopeptidase yscIV [Umbelopsis nana]
MCSGHPTFREPNTLSNLNDVQVKHIHLDLTVDFVQRLLGGHATLTFQPLQDHIEHVVLDTSFLHISAVEMDSKPLEFHLAERHPAFGSALNIKLPGPVTDKDSLFDITIKYTTTERCTAIQFLEPEQTVGKQFPYLFSQCQIHARSFVPCQDSPSVKLTYSASISSALPVLMSAIKTGEEPSSAVLAGQPGFIIYKFEQRTSIPSYLIAIVSGNLAGREIGPRSTVWCEPEMVDAAAWEFADTEKFIAAGESILTPYEWGRYDLLVLPPSFPYGGMENPCLSFITPTLLAGDRSLVAVVAHEISHSWTGNLVTTKSWEHFWLNEGWTVFVERKILARLHGEPQRHFSAIIGYKALTDSVELFGHESPATLLNPDLSGIDPDDYFSTVPYEKGFNLLFYIEQVVGGPGVFEPYMKAHIRRFAHNSITTSDWKSYLYEYMQENHGDQVVKQLDTIDWHQWMKCPGMPPVKPHFDTTLAEACYSLASAWKDAKERGDTEFKGIDNDKFSEFTSLQKVVFLESLSEAAPFPHQLLASLDTCYQLSSVRNCEIRFRWQRLCLSSDYELIYPSVCELLTEQGRMKFVRPLYRYLNQAKNGSELAKSTYLANKTFYHPIAALLIEKDIGITGA